MKSWFADKMIEKGRGAVNRNMHGSLRDASSSGSYPMKSPSARFSSPELLEHNTQTAVFVYLSLERKEDKLPG